ncbi:MAG: hypothetical protein IJT16_10525 [Lachnospiraceae bacterium]|nr:hypothetical protein [Lachnospiraceae bacterium]
MACFLVPAAEAVVSAAVNKGVKNAEKNEISNLGEGEVLVYDEAHRIPFSEKLSWLTKLLLGGSVLLMFEHIWHGEVTLFFPFLTAMSDPAAKAEMLHEMGTVGVSMALIITGVWIGMVLASDAIEKRAIRSFKKEKKALTVSSEKERE